MGMPEEIIQLILGQGQIAAQQAKERIAQDEIQRQNKHRMLKNTLMALATFGPYFIPGAGIVPALGKFGMSAAGRAFSNRGFGSDEDRYTEYR